MSETYRFDPDAWPPVLAGTVAGAVAAIVAALVSLPLRSPDEIVFNSLSVVLVSLALGAVAGSLWRRLRANAHATRDFGIAMAGGLFVALAAVAVVDLTLFGNAVGYAAPLAAIIFITLAFLTPLFGGVTASPWIATIPIVIALALGVGLFGRGNVASGELTIDDAAVASTADTDASAGDPPTTLAGEIALPDDLAVSYEVQSGIATYTVEERLQGLDATTVGTSESVQGTLTPGSGFTFTLDLQSFTSDQSRRDSRVRGWFADHPNGTFSADAVALPPSATVGADVEFEVEGTLEINAIALPVSWSVTARVNDDATIGLQAETDIVLSDFDVPVLATRIVTMTDAAHLEVAMSLIPTDT